MHNLNYCVFPFYLIAYVFLFVYWLVVQETRWLEYMRSQLSTTHGDVGVSVAAVDKLIGEHCKFIETAQVRTHTHTQNTIRS